MAFVMDNADYAKERGMNISPFCDQGSLLYFVSRTPASFGMLPLAVAWRSIALGLMAFVIPLFVIRTQRFKFLWENAPWFQSVIRFVLLWQITLVLIVVWWPSPWFGLLGYLVALFSGGYEEERERLAREFNIPEKEP